MRHPQRFAWPLLLGLFLAPGANSQTYEVFDLYDDQSVRLEAVSASGGTVVGHVLGKAPGEFEPGRDPQSIRIDGSEFRLMPFFGAHDVSADGERLLARGHGIWTDAGGLQPVGPPPDAVTDWVDLMGISDDGRSIAGSAQIEGGLRGFVWRDGVSTFLAAVPNRRGSEALGLSGDGSVAFGASYVTDPLRFDAVAWSDGGFRILPVPFTMNAADSELGVVWASNRDGTVLAGQSGPLLGPHRAVRWRGEEAIEIPAPAASDEHRAALAVSGDGVVVLARVGQRPYVWDPRNGSRYVSDILASHGVETPDPLLYLEAMSDDARVLAGWNHVVTLPPDTFPTRPEHDRDLDLIADDVDNCIDAFNPSQTDADLDGFGNACDADYDNDGLTSMSDFRILYDSWKTRRGDPYFDASVDCDDNGRIGKLDLKFFREHFGKRQAN